MGLFKKKDSGEFHPLRSIIIAFILFLLIKGTALDIKGVDGQSMEPWIHSGEIVLLNRLAYGVMLPFMEGYLIRWGEPGIGDVVAVRHPVEDKVIIKRVLGLPGHGLIYTPGTLVVEDRVIGRGHHNLEKTIGLTEIPAGKILIIGDNHNDSIDSRSFGLVDSSSVIGEVIKIVDMVQWEK